MRKRFAAFAVFVFATVLWRERRRLFYPGYGRCPTSDCRCCSCRLDALLGGGAPPASPLTPPPCLRYGSDGAKYLLYYPVGRMSPRPAGFAFLDGLLAKLSFRTGAPVFHDA